MSKKLSTLIAAFVATIAIVAVVSPFAFAKDNKSSTVVFDTEGLIVKAQDITIASGEAVAKTTLVTVTTAENYTFKEKPSIITTNNNKPIKDKDISGSIEEGSFSFEMPNQNVSISAVLDYTAPKEPEEPIIDEPEEPTVEEEEEETPVVAPFTGTISTVALFALATALILGGTLAAKQAKEA